jgi:CubicO group peptidase (beta-lactamase class C family)
VKYSYLAFVNDEILSNTEGIDYKQFMICSISKLFAWIAIRIVEYQRNIDCNIPIETYGIYFDGSNKITINNLLRHETTIPKSLYNKILHDHYDEKLKIVHGWTKDDILNSLKEGHYDVDTTPDEHYKRYNSMNYSLISIIFRNKIGIEINEFIQNEILNKIGMNETMFMDQEHLEKYASKYEIVFPLFDIAGNILSTINDMNKFLDSEFIKFTEDWIFTKNNIFFADGYNGNDEEGKRGIFCMITKCGKNKFIGFYPEITNEQLESSLNDKIIKVISS